MKADSGFQDNYSVVVASGRHSPCLLRSGSANQICMNSWEDLLQGLERQRTMVLFCQLCPILNGVCFLIQGFFYILLKLSGI